ncbi:hypothetical protein [Amantichitinum ursilacus]|uniref:Uncharacterized protein n=1 Tax=Amantichitinum ursilacus TaxID=857265 RepID=A0A0N1JRJ2_9NEIS|nr:hypothetical protein [Amantichitinum ursilacus]KPC49352.1 hypothetical protein WG78_20695 [Amantichitinum ursilacus]
MLDVIYRKTERGVEEITTRASGLSLKLRQLLIMIDGKTPNHALPLAMDEKELVHRLLELEWDGLIERHGSMPAPKAAAPAPAAMPSGVAAVHATAKLPSSQIARIRAILNVSNHTHHGTLDNLISQMDTVHTLGDLERALAQYLTAMQQRGREADAQSTLAQIRQVLR